MIQPTGCRTLFQQHPQNILQKFILHFALKLLPSFIKTELLHSAFSLLTFCFCESSVCFGASYALGGVFGFPEASRFYM